MIKGYANIKGTNDKKKIIFFFKAFSKDGVTLVKDRVCLNFNNFMSESYSLGVKVKEKIKI